MWVQQAGDVQPWVQTLLALLGGLGGLGGVAAGVGWLVQRRKFNADAADVLTDTALTLVEPLKARVRELDAEVQTARRETTRACGEATKARQQWERANEEITTLRAGLSDMTAMVATLRAAILAPDADLVRLRQMVTAQGRNGSIRREK